jgi:glycosyltransferase 2 family protein
MQMAHEASHRENTGRQSVTPLPRRPRGWIDYAWSAIGIVAVFVAGYLLYKELSGISPRDVSRSFARIPPERWALAICGTILAYAALAWYDRIALLHLGKRLNWVFISVTSFTTYALAHNIGASVFSGAAVRYRAYSTKGLSAAEVGVLVALTAFTFTLGNVLLGGCVLVGEPELAARLLHVNVHLARATGFAMLAAVALYVVGSWFELPALTIRGLTLVYPRMPIVVRQLIAAPIELIGAAAIIYFAMPSQWNPGYFVILGVFLASFTAALISHAPGGLGVLEFLFIKAMPEVPKADVLVALLVFRLLYLLVPLAIGLVVVMIFEKGQLAETLRSRSGQTPADGRSPPSAGSSNVIRLDEAVQRRGQKPGPGQHR